ncbi:MULTISPECIES: hypothetical protein [unclassified Aureispira]|uniref:hypothetical protein n=1 Tax=unclassified Aureispira TaxID=2649989 RepID=UPI000697C5B2|nr:MULTISPECIES: hypothetical protein [unclassified Aureispira]WMX15747.1 hypothetical protein QP953_05040 [Aureispira sp. CCB-E]
MKNLSRFILISLFAVSFFSSCKKQDNGIWEVALSVEVEGDLESWSTISYYDKAGQLQTETLTPDWNTTFELDSGADLIVRAKGMLDGDHITVKYKATIGGKLVRSGGSGVSTKDQKKFDIWVEDKLE